MASAVERSRRYSPPCSRQAYHDPGQSWSLSRQKRLGLGEFWTFGIAIGGQGLQFCAVFAGCLAVARSFRSTSSVVKALEAVGIAFQGALELGERLRRTAERQEHL